jgi:outer membrane lipoprotein-sorting protein
MRKIQSLVVVVVSLFLCSAAWAAGPVSSNFSADIVTTSHGSTHTSKVYSKGGRSRMEMSGEGREMITITRPDKNVVWMLMPATRTYMEMPLNRKRAGISSQLSDPSVQTEKKFVANETVEGHPAKKYHVTVIMDGKKEASGFLWEATDMNNFPVKHQTEDGEITTVWKNVKRGGVSDSLFELPAEYKKMSMPRMGGFRRPLK